MHLITQKQLIEFWKRHRTSEAPLRAWVRIMKGTNFSSFPHLREKFPSADYVEPYTIFDVGGNNWRIITVIHFNRAKIYIRHVVTHSEYDKWNKRR